MEERLGQLAGRTGSVSQMRRLQKDLAKSTAIA